MTSTRMPDGRFASGASGNPRGRPTKAQRIRERYEPELLAMGMTPEQINALMEAGVSRLKSVATIAAMAAAVIELTEKPHSVRRRRRRPTA